MYAIFPTVLFLSPFLSELASFYKLTVCVCVCVFSVCVCVYVFSLLSHPRIWGAEVFGRQLS